MSLLLEGWPEPQEPPSGPRKGDWMYWLAAMIVVGLALCAVIAHSRGYNW